jgi:pimeloyl-ACP methyl ester carboxylesterase
MQKFLKTLRTLLVWGIILAVLCGVIFYFAQDLIVFPGRGLFTSNPGEWHSRVAALGYQGFLPAEFTGPEGQVINGIWAKSGPSAGPAILWFHSREQTTTEINQDLKILTQAGLHVLALEFRGFGVSRGETSEANLLADGAAAIDWLLKQENVAGGRVFVGGVGFGGNMAMKIAARNTVHGIVAVNPLPDMATGLAEKFPMVPLAFLLKDKFELAPDLGRLSAPILLIHGSADKVVSMDRIEAIEAKVSVPVRLVEVPGGGHLDTLERGGTPIAEQIDLFKDRPR